MRKIFKFQVGRIEFQCIETHAGSRALHAGVQGGIICIWAEVNTYAPKVDNGLSIFIIPNGCEVPSIAKKYISTVFDDEFVWHIYQA